GCILGVGCTPVVRRFIRANFVLANMLPLCHRISRFFVLASFHAAFNDSTRSQPHTQAYVRRMLFKLGLCRRVLVHHSSAQVVRELVVDHRAELRPATTNQPTLRRHPVNSNNGCDDR
ncbi:MAG: hypothetical protein SGPRY_006089, partial [Prymnesium sp.]